MSKNKVLILVLAIGLATVVGNCVAQEELTVKMNIPEPEITIFNIPDDMVQLIVDNDVEGRFYRTIEGVSFGIGCYGGEYSLEIVASDTATDNNGYMHQAPTDGMSPYLTNPLNIMLPKETEYKPLDDDVSAIYDCGDYKSQTIGFQQQIEKIDPFGDYYIDLSFDIYPVPRRLG
jgi:hypothetical protein